MTEADCLELLPYVAGVAARFSSDDQYQSEAQLALVLACRSFDAGRGTTLKQWVGVVVSRRLGSMRRRARAERLVGQHEAPRRCIGLHDVVRRLPARLAQVAHDRWIERMKWGALRSKYGVDCRALISEARDAARLILDNEGMDVD